MSLTLYYHPLSSFCWKALIGLYELGLPFEKHLVDLADDAARAAFVRLWPIGKFPVLRDEARGRTVPESSIVLEYADGLAASPGVRRLIPADPQRAIECRLRDRLYDDYVHHPLQKLVNDRLRGDGEKDPVGVAQARAQIETAYGLLDGLHRTGPWALGDDFTLADCAAFPSLHYANRIIPIGDRWGGLSAYLERLRRRPSVARVVDEAAPYAHMFPG
jgi:glutathione S-transferase